MRRPPEIPRVEKVLWSLYVHGPSAIFDHLQALRDMYHHDRDAFLQVRMQLWLDGMEIEEIMDLVSLSGRHGEECVCWRCIERTLSALRRCEAKMRVDAEMRSEAILGQKEPAE